MTTSGPAKSVVIHDTAHVVSVQRSEATAVIRSQDEAVVVHDPTMVVPVITEGYAPGGTTVQTYTHYQMTAAAVWDIVHNLGKFPSVSVVDSAGNVVLGDVTYIGANRVTVRFSGAFAGKAYLN